ncbi:HAE1 family hydrophobic/amphiphilic exporter-1 [Virgibacillus natechei]|uniref:HAE1 family hydrophobic/amphiphilic exporter-1 n=1 Tax=Virgibacillus natechei TaxID=1216297 RepID=A0ABS4IL32_9BACI|nr:efflux RND transporter permease subunit [Virgibacillus natechei]MBP1971674.1 HAE1 family hydrophobic/amphiphilic exporter-1 [Virgibacillus natechei]UZD12564.1 efflux RND transporter permease subunit [Virgibacillus natechei]
MKLVKTSVKRPVGVIILALAIIAFGLVSVRDLAVDLFPEIELPIAVVATSYGEAAPQDVESLVSEPIEAAVSSVEGIETVQSQSQSGSSLVMLMFSSGTDLDQALLDVRESVDQVGAMLPDQAGDPNIMRFNPDQMPIVTLGLTGGDTEALTDVANDDIVPYFERQEGVASVTVEGGRESEVQLVLDPEKLQQYGVSEQVIAQALNSSNQSASVGNVERGDKDLQMRVTGEFESLEDIERTIIQTETETTVYVEDIAEVNETVKETSETTLVNGEQSIVLSIMKNSDANTVGVAEVIRDGMDELNEDMVSDVNLEMVMDTSEFIEMSIDSVIQNILIAGAIAIFVLLLFLKSVRATLVVGVSIPIALVSTFALLYFSGQTLNVLTLGGLALGIGMMVDSAIVIIEHIDTYRKRGYGAVESAIKGASELAPAVIASTTTTLVVFLPIIYVEGIASDLFTPLALAVSFALITSLAAAITLVPMLSSKLLTKAMENNGRRYWFDRFLEWLRDKYQVVLEWALHHRKTTIAGTVLAIAGSLALTPLIGAELIPGSDEGQMQIRVETVPGNSAEYMEAKIEQVEEEIQGYGDIIETNFVSYGGGGMMGGSANTASYTILLVPAGERDQTTSEFVQEVDEDLQGIVGAEITVSEMSDMDMGNPIQIQLNGPEHDVLRELSDQVVNRIDTVEGVFNPETGAAEGVPQMNIEIDDDQAAMYGLNQEQILGQVQTKFTGQVVTQISEEGQEIDVTMLYPEDERSTIRDLQDMNIQSQTGSTIPLEEVASFNEVQGPVALTRENQQPQSNISSDITGRDLGSVVSDVEDELANMSLPEGYSYEIGGQAEDMAESFTELALALVFSIFLVYAVMAIQFENFLFPLIIMFALPATVVGVMIGLFVTGLPLSVVALMGVIMLAGIVVNNSIVLVDYMNILRRNGMDRYEAIIEAGRTRLRPILMMTLTTVLAMIPIALALGEGAELQQPLAVTIIFGLSVSSIFTLVLIPVVYSMFDDLSQKITGKRKKKEEA